VVVFSSSALALFGIGLLGEYVGRIYAQVRERPRYIIEGVLEAPDGENERDEPDPVSYAGEDARADRAIPQLTRAVVFAYSEVGVRCVGGIVGPGGSRSRSCFTHAGRPGRAAMVRQREKAG